MTEEIAEAAALFTKNDALSEPQNTTPSKLEEISRGHTQSEQEPGRWGTKNIAAPGPWAMIPTTTSAAYVISISSPFSRISVMLKMIDEQVFRFPW